MLHVTQLNGFGIRQTGDPYFSNVSLLLHADGDNNSTTFADSSKNNFTVNRTGNILLSTTAYKFGVSSIKGDGTGYLRPPIDAAFSVLGGAFTVEAWVNIPGGSLELFAKFSTTFGIAYEHSFSVDLNVASLYYGIRGTNQSVTQFYWPTPMVANTWNHVVIQRDGSGNWSNYLNGVKGTQYRTSPLQSSIVFGPIITGTYNNSVNFNNTSIQPQIGGDIYSFSNLNGYMDDYRFTKGIARYSGNFTPPQAPFPNY